MLALSVVSPFAYGGRGFWYVYSPPHTSYPNHCTLSTLLGPSYHEYPSRWLVSYRSYPYGYMRHQPISKAIYYIWCSVAYELCCFGLFWDYLWSTFGVWRHYVLPGVTPARALEAPASFTPVPFVRVLTMTICCTVTVAQNALASVLTI